MIAQSIDLLRLHEITTAIIVPNPTPGPTYRGCVYTGPLGLAVQEIKRRTRVGRAKKFFFMKCILRVMIFIA